MNIDLSKFIYHKDNRVLRKDGLEYLEEILEVSVSTFGMDFCCRRNAQIILFQRGTKFFGSQGCRIKFGTDSTQERREVGIFLLTDTETLCVYVYDDRLGLFFLYFLGQKIHDGRFSTSFLSINGCNAAPFERAVCISNHLIDGINVLIPPIEHLSGSFVFRLHDAAAGETAILVLLRRIQTFQFTRNLDFLSAKQFFEVLRISQRFVKVMATFVRNIQR